MTYSSLLKKILDAPQIIFLVIALILGGIMLYITPAASVPDEHHHMRKTTEIADGIFYSKKPIKETSLDKNMRELVPQKYYPKSNEYHYASRNGSVMYLTPALGIKLADLFTDNSQIIFYMGRIFNFLTYILLCFFAIKLTPVFKYPMLYTALLPMSICLGMSYSADSFNNGFAFLYFAYLFKIIYSKEETSRKDFALISLFALIGAFCKGLIYPLSLLVFLPKFSNKFKLNKWVYICGLIVLTGLISIIWVKINPANLNDKCKVINDMFYIFKAPMTVIDRIVYTTMMDIRGYVDGLIGILGWLQIPLPKYCYNIGLLMFGVMFLVFNEPIKYKHRLMAFVTFMGMYFIFQYMQLVYWAEVNKIIINGFQGRYLISLIPLICIVLTSSRQIFSQEYKYTWKMIIISVNISLLIVSLARIAMYYNL